VQLEIWVKDSQRQRTQIYSLGKLPQEVRLIRGWSGHPFLTLQELDNTFQACCIDRLSLARRVGYQPAGAQLHWESYIHQVE